MIVVDGTLAEICLLHRGQITPEIHQALDSYLYLAAARRGRVWKREDREKIEDRLGERIYQLHDCGYGGHISSGSLPIVTPRLYQRALLNSQLSAHLKAGLDRHLSSR